MMHSNKISQMVPLQWSVILRWATQGPLVYISSLILVLDFRAWMKIDDSWIVLRRWPSISPTLNVFPSS